VEPVVATLLGFVWLGEAMGVDQMAGIALIIAAALLLAARAGNGSDAERGASLMDRVDNRAAIPKS
jgi:drug/metabolite transporter (DMT)-like permease